MHVEMSRDIVTCPYTAGGRSRRGSHKAGTTVVMLVRQVRHGFTKTVKVSPNLTDAHIKSN